MATPATATKGRPAKKPVKKNIYTGIVHIQSTFNNTIVTITDINGAVISWASAGSRGFKGSRKSTPFAAQLAAEEASRRAQEHGLRSVAVFVKEPSDVGVTTTSTVASDPEVTVPRSHVTVPPSSAHVPCEGVDETYVIEGGSASTTCTSWASDGPASCTVSV